MKILKLFIFVPAFLFITTAQAMTVPPPDILTKIIQASRNYGAPFNVYSFTDENKEFVYYLEQARYLGNCLTPSGPMHIAGFRFIRSSPIGSETPPARGQNYLVFFDENLNIKKFWLISFGIEEPDLRGSQLWFRNEFIVDFLNNKGAHMFDGNNTVLIDGEIKILPN